MQLTADEKLIYSTRFSGRIFIKPVVVVLMLILISLLAGAIASAINTSEASTTVHYLRWVLILIGIISIMKPIIKYYMSHFVITTKRIVIKHGLLARRSYEMMLTKIESINVNQSLWDRLLWGSGTLVITGTGGSKEVFPEVGKAITFQKKLNEVLHV